MDWTLIFTAIGAVATVISTIIAVRAKNESKKILEQIKEERSRNIENRGKVNVSNSGNNSGIINAINSGDIHK